LICNIIVMFFTVGQWLYFFIWGKNKHFYWIAGILM